MSLFAVAQCLGQSGFLSSPDDLSVSRLVCTCWRDALPRPTARDIRHASSQLYDILAQDVEKTTQGLTLLPYSNVCIGAIQLDPGHTQQTRASGVTMIQMSACHPPDHTDTRTDCMGLTVMACGDLGRKKYLHALISRPPPPALWASPANIAAVVTIGFDMLMLTLLTSKIRSLRMWQHMDCLKLSVKTANATWKTSVRCRLVSQAERTVHGPNGTSRSAGTCSDLLSAPQHIQGLCNTYISLERFLTEQSCINGSPNQTLNVSTTVGFGVFGELCRAKADRVRAAAIELLGLSVDNASPEMISWALDVCADTGAEPEDVRTFFKNLAGTLTPASMRANPRFIARLSEAYNIVRIQQFPLSGNTLGGMCLQLQTKLGQLVHVPGHFFKATKCVARVV